MKERLFKFKQFSVHHSQSAMKVGVDGVLVGAWADASGQRVLDAGCGCGMIALMVAQRNPAAVVDAVDIHAPSVDEANLNFSLSPWGNRLRARVADFNDLASGQGQYDLIVSNPPFFDSGVAEPETPREVARHTAGLSPLTLAELSAALLEPGGRLCLITVAGTEENIAAAASRHGLARARLCRVTDHEGAPCKRVLMEFVKTDGTDPEHDPVPQVTDLVMFNPDKTPTEGYRALTGPFYLHF